jgi:molybdate transport system substrate-binding protein
MHELAQSRGSGQVGCTQSTEILYTPGVMLVGPLPAEFELATIYAVAIARTTRQPFAAQESAQLLAAPAQRALRIAGGFED